MNAGEFDEFSIENGAFEERRDHETLREKERKEKLEKTCVFLPQERNLVFFRGLDAEKQGENELKLASLCKSSESLVYMDTKVEIQAKWNLMREKSARGGRKHVVLMKVLVENKTRDSYENVELTVKGISSSKSLFVINLVI